MGREEGRVWAYIEEADCIGCTQCLAVCPTDAIIGAVNKMHTVVRADCTGCAWCVPTCPVDCIQLVARDASQQFNQLSKGARLEQSAHYRRRYQAHTARKQRQKTTVSIPETTGNTRSGAHHFIEAAVKRAQLKKGKPIL